jgi:hypothetical protein
LASVDLPEAEPSALASLRVVLVLICSRVVVSVEPLVLLLVVSSWVLASATMRELALPQRVGNSPLPQTVRWVSPPHQQQNLDLHRLHQDQQLWEQAQERYFGCLCLTLKLAAAARGALLLLSPLLPRAARWEKLANGPERTQPVLGWPA